MATPLRRVWTDLWLRPGVEKGGTRCSVRFGKRCGTCREAGRVYRALCAEERRMLRRVVAFLSFSPAQVGGGGGKVVRAQACSVRGSSRYEVYCVLAQRGGE